MKRVVLVHGWGGGPEDGWFPWLKNELGQEGVEVIAPLLPDTDTPHIGAWVEALRAAVGGVDSDTYFVGHSLGCQAIMRLLETLPEDTQCGGAVFVVGFFLPLNHMETEEEKVIDKEWAETPIDTVTVRLRLPKSIALFSDDDPDVPVENAPLFASRLGSEIRIEHGYGHFAEDDGCTELPIVLQSLRTLMA